MTALDVHEMTIQMKVTDFQEGSQWYEKLLRRSPDFIPHEDFAEWELRPGCWLQVAKGEPNPGSGPLRLGVADIEEDRSRILAEFGIEVSPIETLKGVVKWCNFNDPCGNKLGFFEDLQ